jgi:peptidoglycan/LPS O-acetylase OafA/YrhL
MTVMNVGSALCLDWCLTHGGGRIGALLRSRPLAFVGVLSYSLYLWQQIFFDPGVNAMRLPLLQALALVSVAALGSYFFIERPFLRLRERLEPALFPRAGLTSPTADPVPTTVASTT